MAESATNNAKIGEPLQSTEQDPSTFRSANRFKFAIFDLDGTLIDYEGQSHVALAEGLRGAGIPPEKLTWELHATVLGLKPLGFSQKILGALDVDNTSFSLEQYVDAYHVEMEALYSKIKPMKGAVELVARLKKLGIPPAIATSSLRKSFDTKMAYHPELLEPMAVIVTGDEVVHGKPAPDIFLEAAARLGADPSECVVFEDSPHGIAAARAAGMYAVAVPDERLPGNDWSAAHRVLSSLEEWLSELPEGPSSTPTVVVP